MNSSEQAKFNETIVDLIEQLTDKVERLTKVVTYLEQQTKLSPINTQAIGKFIND